MAKKKTSVLLPGSISDLVKGLQSGTQPNNDTNNHGSEEKKEEEREEQEKHEEEELRQSDEKLHSDGEHSENGVLQENHEQGAEEGRQVSPTPDMTEEPKTYQTMDGSEGRGDQPVGVHDSQLYQDRAAEQPSPRNGVIRPANARNESQASRPVPNGYLQGATNRDDVQARRGRRPKAAPDAEREYHVTRDDSKDSWQLFLDLAHDYKVGGGKLATIYIDETLKNVLDRLKYAGDEKLPTSAILSSIVARFFYDHEKDIKDVLFKNTLPW